jgi:23S rRNA (cytidine2498-2'-O)-methyltransferase
MHRLFTDEGGEEFLLHELRRGWPDAHHEVERSGWVSTDAPLTTGANPALIAFSRQAFLDGIACEAPSINLWADRLAEAIIAAVPPEQPWRLHLWPAYGEGRAGLNRCGLIRDALMEKLRKKRRQLLKTLEETTEPLSPQTSLVQLALRSPEEGVLSVAVAPLPWQCRSIVSAFPEGAVPVAVDKGAPSRAFAKLVEAEQRLGHVIGKGETCVDLGASPGSWSYVALSRGARVIAVDRAELRTDLMRNPKLHFHCGDAFKFRTEARVDWLLCDVIAAPQRSIDLLLEWLREGRMSAFVVSIKFIGGGEYPLIDQLKAQAAPLCREFGLTRLSANKNEVCAFGVAS